MIRKITLSIGLLLVFFQNTSLKAQHWIGASYGGYFGKMSFINSAGDRDDNFHSELKSVLFLNYKHDYLHNPKRKYKRHQKHNGLHPILDIGLGYKRVGLSASEGEFVRWELDYVTSRSLLQMVYKNRKYVYPMVVTGLTLDAMIRGYQVQAGQQYYLGNEDLHLLNLSVNIGTGIHYHLAHHVNGSVQLIYSRALTDLEPGNQKAFLNGIELLMGVSFKLLHQ